MITYNTHIISDIGEIVQDLKQRLKRRAEVLLLVEFMDMLFDWDENKARINENKHGISFLEAMTAFNDPNAIIIDDDEHSDDEERFILLGMSSEVNLLMVCHCYRDEDDIIRLISARKANKRENRKYGGRGK